MALANGWTVYRTTTTKSTESVKGPMPDINYMRGSHSRWVPVFSFEVSMDFHIAFHNTWVRIKGPRAVPHD